MFQHWRTYAFMSALFAGLTAIFAKLGVKNIPSNYATLFRTGIIILMFGILMYLCQIILLLDGKQTKAAQIHI